ncbi:MAG: cobalamin-dependent protein [Verrucomicrobiia bacterium]|jgi:DNA-binding transcriptional MerR regulator/methylmalonyl-CoA mutase cobalamin-binding subunit
MHPIKYVAKMTGLSPHVIRVWERRYGVTLPTRSDTNRRLYSDADIEKLTLLRRATRAGHNIGQLVKMSTDQLKQIAGDVADGSTVRRPSDAVAAPPLDMLLASSLDAVQRLDGSALENLLGQASVYHSQQAVIEKMIVPLMEKIGDLWSDGALRPAHEHLASAIVRSFVANMAGTYRPDESAPRLVVTTPAGQWHEIGALLVTASASALGWRATYLGPNLPADEIAGAVDQNGAQAVALSIVYPGDDPNVGHELRKLRRAVGDGVKILVGGRVAANYQKAIEEIGSTRIVDIPHLRAELTALRSPVG